MTRILINLIVLYLVALIYDVNGKLSNKLVGGAYGSITDYPFQVSVRINDDHHLCGGCIITPLHILTSASCVTSDVNIIYGNLKVLSGTNDRNNRDNYGTIHDVDLVIMHHEYSPRKFWANDICLLKLTKILTFTQSRQLIYWPLFINLKSYSFQIIGWEGLIADNRRLSKISVTMLRQSECENYFKSYGIHNGQSCIKTKQPSHNIIEGDGGNPIVTARDKSLIGIISLIPLESNHPSIITQTTDFYDTWLLQMLKK